MVAARDIAGSEEEPIACMLLPTIAPAKALLRPVVFSTAGVEARHRFELWRSTYDSINSLTLLAPEPAGFAARNEVWTLGHLALSSNAAPAMGFARTAQHIRRDALDHWVIRVAVAGEAQHRVGDAAFAVTPMRPVLFSLGEPSVSQRNAADWISVYVPRDAFPELSAGFAALGPGPLRGAGAGLLADTLVLLKRRLPETPAEDVPVLAEMLRAMIAAALPRGCAPPHTAPSLAAAVQRERIRRIIRENIGSPMLGPAKICRLAGTSRSQLYRLFEPHGGVARYVQSLRLRLAHAALADPAIRTPIAVIAERLGFFDASTFSRVFRREFGCTPSEVRQGLRNAPVPRGASPSAAEAYGFGHYLRGLGGARGPAWGSLVA